MAITDGQTADQTNFNNAFASKQNDNTLDGKQTINDDVTVNANANVNGDLTVTGNLTATTGTLTNIDTVNTQITDNNIVINKGGNDASADGAGLTIERTGVDGSVIYDDVLESKFKVGPLGSEKEIVNVDGSQSLLNKTIDGDNNTITNLAHGSEVDNPSSGVHGVTGSVLGTSDAQTVTNKTIDGDNNTITNLAHGSEVDNPSSGVHGVTGSVVGTSDAQALTNKTLDADNNTVSNIDDGNIKAGAAIARNKTASGTADHVLINDAGGVISSEANLDITRGGTGAATANAGFNALSPLTTKGDLVGFSTVNARLPVGSNGQVLEADSAETLGVKWATPSGGGGDPTGPNPTLTFNDTDQTDADPSFTISADATDTGSGTEDVDVSFKSIVAGALTEFMRLDADGDFNGAAELGVNATIQMDKTGNASVPAITGPANGFRTGLYWNNTEMHIGNQGINVASFAKTFIRPELKILSALGTPADPQYGFSTGQKQGMYSTGIDQLGFSTNGVLRAEIKDTEVDFKVQPKYNGVPLLSNAPPKIVGGGNITASVPAGSPVTVLQNTGGTDWSVAFNSGSEVGHTITPTVSMTLDTFSLWNKKSGSPTSILKGEIWTVSAGQPGVLLATSTNTIDASTWTTSYSKETFNFASVSLTGSTQYFFIQTELTPGGSGSWFTDINFGGDPYAGGDWRFHNGPGSFVTSTNNDARFEFTGVDIPAGPQITFDAAFEFEAIGLDYSDNNLPISESPIVFTNDNDVAYVTLNTATAGPALSITVDSLPNVPAGKTIVARRRGSEIIVGGSSLKLKNGETGQLYEIYPAANVPFTPTTPGDWSVVPSRVGPALDELAAASGGGGDPLLNVEFFTGADTLDAGNDIALCSGGPFTLTLPTAVGITGKRYRIKKTDITADAANKIIIDANGAETIDGLTTRELHTHNETYVIISDGANWQILEHKTDTPWVIYTPGIAGMVLGNGTLQGFWQRRGDTGFFRTRFTLGSTSSVTSVHFGIPTGMTRDGSKMVSAGAGTNIVGGYVALDSGSAFRHAAAYDRGDNAVGALGDGGGGAWSTTGPHTWATGDSMGADFSMPITGWSE